MRVLGHPAHPMLVHAPLGFWTVASICDVAALFGFAEAWRFAWPCLAIGLIAAAPAMIAGLLDYAALKPADAALAARHMLLTAGAWLFYLGALVARADGVALRPEPTPLAIALSLVGFAILAAGAWCGAELVYRRGVGVAREP